MKGEHVLRSFHVTHFKFTFSILILSAEHCTAIHLLPNHVAFDIFSWAEKQHQLYALQHAFLSFLNVQMLSYVSSFWTSHYKHMLASSCFKKYLSHCVASFFFFWNFLSVKVESHNRHGLVRSAFSTLEKQVCAPAFKGLSQFFGD